MLGAASVERGRGGRQTVGAAGALPTTCPQNHERRGKALWWPHREPTPQVASQGQSGLALTPLPPTPSMHSPQLASLPHFTAEETAAQGGQEPARCCPATDQVVKCPNTRS